MPHPAAWTPPTLSSAHLAVALHADSAEAAGAFNVQTGLVRSVSSAAEPWIVGELAQSELAQAAKPLDAMAAAASAQGDHEAALAATFFSSLVQLPQLLDTLSDPKVGKLRRFDATLKETSPLLNQIPGLKGPLAVTALVFACKQTADAWLDGKLTLADVLRPTAAAVQGLKLVHVPVPAPIDIIITVLSTFEGVTAIEHSVGADSARQIATILPTAS